MLWYRLWAEKCRGGWITPLVFCGLSAMLVLAPGKAARPLDSPDARTAGHMLAYAWAGVAAAMALNGVWKEVAEKSILYTLSLPVTRRRVLGTWTAWGSAALAGFALIAWLTVFAVALLAAKTYPLVNALLHALLLTAGGLVFYAFGLLVAVSVSDPVRALAPVFVPPILLIVLSASGRLPRAYDVFHVMAGGAYFSGGGMPWGGLAISLLLCGVCFYLSLRVVERRDF